MLIQRWRERLAAQNLNAGGVILHATEGVFGLACCYNSESAYQRIGELKSRQPSDKPFLLVAAKINQITRLVDLGDNFEHRVAPTWPGPTTWIFDLKSNSYPWLGSAEGTLAVRITAHPQVRRLCEKVGPIISTSANVSGAPPCLTLSEAKATFGKGVDYYLVGQLQQPGKVSQIGDARTGEWVRK